MNNDLFIGIILGIVFMAIILFIMMVGMYIKMAKFNKRNEEMTKRLAEILNKGGHKIGRIKEKDNGDINSRSRRLEGSNTRSRKNGARCRYSNDSS